jgi:hypothetical protein
VHSHDEKMVCEARSGVRRVVRSHGVDPDVKHLYFRTIKLMKKSAKLRYNMACSQIAREYNT